MSQVVLIGPPGAGKSAAGALLARQLGTSFRDTDEDIEATAGKPVPDIFLEDGEDAFRDLERTAVAKALDEHDGVLALGSGAVLNTTVREILAGRTVVYLAADFTTVAKRAGLDRPRVVLPGNPRGRLRAMLEERRAVYESLATITVQADDAADAGELAAEISRRLDEAR
ncbi:MAG TPA: shikimate kinase [Streptosporangiaceae bacterium]|nr:shikimate kinase [Streptosporangiaceae bacterium]